MMTSETVEALERIQRQIARLRDLQSHIRAMRASGQLSPSDFAFVMARCERAIENVSSLYNLLLTEHRLYAKRCEYLAGTDQAQQLSLF